MNKLVVLVVLILVVVGGYFILNSPTSSATTTISLTRIPISFELPSGYSIFQTEGFEGGYGTTISVGKKIGDGHLKYAPLKIEIFNRQGLGGYEAREYVDAAFQDQKRNLGANPEYIEILGNKATRYTVDSDDSTTIIGYLNNYQITISSSTYGSGVESNEELFDTVVSTLRVNN